MEFDLQDGSKVEMTDSDGNVRTFEVHTPIHASVEVEEGSGFILAAVLTPGEPGSSGGSVPA